MQRENTFDILENINGAMVHHGEIHNRLYMMKAEKENWDTLIPNIENLAREKKYDKILGRVPANAKEVFQSRGYEIEAEIPRMYNGEKTGYFLADYLEKDRGFCSEKQLKTIESVKMIALAAYSSGEDSHFDLPSNLHVRKMNKSDLQAFGSLHEKAFKKYPFPIHKTEYLLELMEKQHEFYGLFQGNELLVSAILKIHESESNVEIVDFATHPNYRGQNLSYYLVQEIKKQIEQHTYKTIYSLVRATSYGLNITFSKHGFSFGGTLYNNTVIHNTMESMNVWYLN